MTYFSNLLLPMLIFIIVSYAVYKRVDIFPVFLDGMTDGFKTYMSYAPTIIALIFAVSIIRVSGVFDMITSFCEMFIPQSFPSETIPLIVIRLISSSSATGILIDLFKTVGPDSFVGRFISIMMSSTETIFYTLSVYFVAINITKTRFTIPLALLINIFGVFVSLGLTKFLF